jgi:AraC family transcriptional regulator of adaptative response / DNA-3-methyladenine glycosylase II
VPPGAPAPGALSLRLPFRAPLWPDSLLGHLAATAVPGVEEWRGGAYRRTLRLPHGPGTVALTPHATSIGCRLVLTDLRDLAPAVARCRRLLDLDADPVAVDTRLAQDPALAPYVAKAPGRRVPRTVDGAELAVRAVLGQQVSTASARTHAARLVLAAGEPVHDPDGGLSRLFPTAAAIAEVDPEVLALPRARRATVLRLARALADGELDLRPGTDPVRARAALAALPGIGPWTLETIAMRALDDPDAFLVRDLGVVLAARELGLGEGRALLRRAEQWAPYRAYASSTCGPSATTPSTSCPSSRPHDARLVLWRRPARRRGQPRRPAHPGGARGPAGRPLPGRPPAPAGPAPPSAPRTTACCPRSGSS